MKISYTQWAELVDMIVIGLPQGLSNKGAYAGGTTYHAYDVVTYSGSTYLCTSTTTGNLPTDAAHWALWAKGISVGTSAPASPATGDLWVDTT